MISQHRYEIYSNVAKKVEFVQLVMAQPDVYVQNVDVLTWVNTFHNVQYGAEVCAFLLP